MTVSLGEGNKLLQETFRGGGKGYKSYEFS